MGRSGPARSLSSSGDTRASMRACSRSLTMTARGFSSRYLRSLSLMRASLLEASAQRWKPPRPLTATTYPALRSSVVFSMGSGQPMGAPFLSHRLRTGPHSGQALGSAWNRRSRGSEYSSRHFSHRGKECMEVFFRS